MLRGQISQPAVVFAGLLAALVGFGLLMLASASWPYSYAHFDGNVYYLLTHQVIFGLVPGLIGFSVAYLIPYIWYKKFAGVALLVSLFLLIAVFIPGIGAEFGTARSWIAIGGFSLQPSEIVKLTFLIYLAAWLEKRGKDELKQASTGLFPFLTVLGVIMLLLILQPDTGSMGVVVLMALAVYFSAGAPVRYFAIFAGFGAALLTALITLSPYRAARFTTFLHPELDPQGVGYHINQALLAVGSGGLFGRGYGHSLQKYQSLPEVAGDSIFAVLAEEFGFIFTVGFLALYVAFLWQGFKLADQAREPFARYLIVGIMSWFSIQALVNMGAMVGLLPITGVPLPFVSYGGTALAVSLTACGVIFNILRTSRDSAPAHRR